MYIHNGDGKMVEEMKIIHAKLASSWHEEFVADWIEIEGQMNEEVKKDLKLVELDNGKLGLDMSTIEERYGSSANAISDLKQKLENRGYKVIVKEEEIGKWW